MDAFLTTLASPAAVAGLIAATLWGPATNSPAWPALTRGRMGSAILVSLAVGLLVFTVVQRLALARLQR
ncbi:MAG TPA: hypothetical protein VHY34_00545 [Caulobacteraceae bacterium]|nr:hypothetical protein [Caulobacteraceae bacterium]